MCLESVNQITVWRVNPETCVESVSMKKMNFCENSKLLNVKLLNCENLKI